MGRDDSWSATVHSEVPAVFTVVYQMKRHGNIQNGGTVIPIANLLANAESGSPHFYPTFLVTIRLSHLVSEIFACDRQTDGWTMRTITIDRPHIEAGQLISSLNQNLQS